MKTSSGRTDEPQGNAASIERSQPLVRRGLLRAAIGTVAAAAGAFAFLSRPKQALASAFFVTSADFTATYEIDNTNDGAGVWGRNTFLPSSPNFPVPDAGVSGTAGAGGRGVAGQSNGGAGLNSSWGVFGTSDVGVGVRAQTLGATSAGVYSTNASGGTAVLGQSEFGSGNTSVGVYGQSLSGSGGIGVLGLCSNDVNSVGVYAQSATGKGFLGFSNSVNGVGAVGVNSTSGIGLYGVSSGGFAGVFSGNVYITGSQTVIGAKSAAVRDAGGNLRRMYSLESPESWFEDFGSGQLSKGNATVQVPTDFAEVVHGDACHVFLTPRGESNGLYVSKQSPGGFTIQESGGGSSNIGFSYRIVAKRRDIAGARLEHVDEPILPEIPEPVKPQPITPAPAAPRRGG